MAKHFANISGGISLVKDGPAILCTVIPHTARCLMAFEEVVAVPLTLEEAENETEGDEDSAMFMEECGEALLFGMGH
jgi:hypothetical protein